MMVELEWELPRKDFHIEENMLLGDTDYREGIIPPLGNFTKWYEYGKIKSLAKFKMVCKK